MFALTGIEGIRVGKDMAAMHVKELAEDSDGNGRAVFSSKKKAKKFPFLHNLKKHDESS